MRNSVRFVCYSVGLLALVAAAAEGCVVQELPSSSKGTSVGGDGGGFATSTTTTGLDGSTNANTTGAGGSAPISCGADPNNACNTCEGNACCAEITACNADAGCAAIHDAFFACRYDDQGNDTGFSTPYCEAAVNPNSDPTATALITCFNTNCTGGVDPNCAAPAEVLPTFTNFAAKFIEDNCAGCHFPGFVAPSGQNLTHFTDDNSWFDWGAQGPTNGPDVGPPPPIPEGNPSWPSEIDYANVVSKKQVIYCGVQPDNLPDNCNPIVDNVLPSDFFSKAQRFPPLGTGMDSHGNSNPCKFAADANPPLVSLGNQTAAAGALVVTGTCPQPSHQDRARMVSWIIGGVPM